ncbi:MAG: hypothetical protein CO028_00725, partial [Candidatus Levybacteria bacterium CG_4_9_14_0_2_um_filter_35_21]
RRRGGWGRRAGASEAEGRANQMKFDILDKRPANKNEKNKNLLTYYFSQSFDLAYFSIDEVNSIIQDKVTFLQ